jgi:hypothetical protein
VETSSSKGNSNNSDLFCSFCNVPNHNLRTCNNLARVIKEHKEKQTKDFNAKQDSSSTSKTKPKSKSTKPTQKTSSAQAGHTSVVEIGNFSDDSSNFKVSGAAAVTLISCISENKNDLNVDLGCSILMTLFLSTITNPSVDSIPICLADSSTIKSTHSGRANIPIGVDALVRTLVVPSLHKPLLLVAALCDEGLLVLFGVDSCQIFKTSDLVMTGTKVGCRYRRGNIFYLPSVADVRFPSITLSAIASSPSISVSSVVSQPSFDSSLMGYHNLLSHLGL